MPESDRASCSLLIAECGVIMVEIFREAENFETFCEGLPRHEGSGGRFDLLLCRSTPTLSRGFFTLFLYRKDTPASTTAASAPTTTPTIRPTLGSSLLVFVFVFAFALPVSLLELSSLVVPISKPTQTPTSLDSYSSKTCRDLPYQERKVREQISNSSSVGISAP
jgi:hypothetical protein